MNQSDQIGDLAKALATVQGKLKPAKKNAKNPFLKNDYADLESIVECSRDLLAANGLAIAQTLDHADGLSLRTTLMHSSGQWIAGQLSLPMSEGKGITPIQALGSEITYARRYGWASIVGIVTGEGDDDGGDPKATTPKPKVVKDGPHTNAQAELLDSLMKSHVWTPDERGKVSAWVAKTPSKKQMAERIDHCTAEIDKRKKAEAGE